MELRKKLNDSARKIGNNIYGGIGDYLTEDMNVERLVTNVGLVGAIAGMTWSASIAIEARCADMSDNMRNSQYTQVFGEKWAYPAATTSASVILLTTGMLLEDKRYGTRKATDKGIRPQTKSAKTWGYI